ncbi:MAG: ATP-dependent Clp protease adapter ClpS [Myxococcota bacterium]
MAKAPDETKGNPAGDLVVEERTRLKKPRKYKVILHNDDYTAMDFVVLVLVKFFRKTQTEATQIMLEVHHRGSGVCGVFTYEVAEAKVMQVSDFAQANGYPLRCTMEPE